MSETDKIATQRASKFVKDIGIYAIGNLGAKLITFLMVPLYTYFVEKSDFGYYDFCFQIVLLIVPFFTMQLRDGAFRFLIDAPSDSYRQSVITMVYRTLLSSTVLSVAAVLVLSCFCTVPSIWLCVLLLISMSFQEVVSQVFRGLGDNKAFVAVGIISAFGIGVFSLIFVVWLRMGVDGVFLANIIARFVAILIVEMRMKTLRRYFCVSLQIGDVTRQIFKYTLPLLPGSFFWWLAGSSDRWFIQEFLGFETNGLYAVAFRFVGVMQTLAIIFYQAWQETAIAQYHSSDRDFFFSRVLNNYIFLLCGLLIVFSFGLKLCYSWLVGAQYQESILYIYPLGVSAVFFAIAAFFDMGYQCAKDTIRTLPGIVLAGVVNVALNFVLIRYIGIYGVLLTSILTYLVLVIYRWIDCRKYFILHIEWRTAFPTLLALASVIPYYLFSAWWSNVLIIAIACGVLWCACPAQLKQYVGAKAKKRGQ